jgi:hypothetical protein
VTSHPVDDPVPAFEADRVLDAIRFASTGTPSSRRRHAFLHDADRGPVAFAHPPARPRGVLR